MNKSLTTTAWTDEDDALDIQFLKVPPDVLARITHWGERSHRSPANVVRAIVIDWVRRAQRVPALQERALGLGPGRRTSAAVPTEETPAPHDDDLRRRVPAIRGEAEAVFAATVTVGDHSLLCLWDDETKAAYDHLEDAWEALHDAVQQHPEVLQRVSALYQTAQAFASRREKEGFVDGFLLGRLPVTPATMDGELLNVLGAVVEAHEPAGDDVAGSIQALVRPPA